MLKTKKELMLELGKLKLELTEFKDRLGAIIELFDTVDTETTRANICGLYAKLTNGRPPMAEIKVDGHEVILQASCDFNRVSKSRITEDIRTKEYVFARAFYCLLCLELGLMTENELAKELNRDRTSIIHYKKLYKTKFSFRKRYDAFVASLM